ITASAASLANSTSVALKLSGEYWSRTSVPFNRGRRSWIHLAPRTATWRISSFDMPKTTRRWGGGVVKVNDDLFRADQGLERALDQVFARLHEHLEPHVIRGALFLDEPA